MAVLPSVLASLNDLKATGIIEDYAIGGGYAALYYDVQDATYDLDVLVVLPSEADYPKLYEHYRAKGARIENVYIFVEGMPVQFFPNYIHRLYNAAIEQADVVRFGDVTSKFVTVEYLIALLLTAFRPKDKIRVRELVKRANRELLLSIIKEFDDERYPLHERYRKVLAGA